MSVLPQYLKDEIQFTRVNAAKFYAKMSAVIGGSHVAGGGQEEQQGSEEEESGSGSEEGSYEEEETRAEGDVEMVG